MHRKILIFFFAATICATAQNKKTVGVALSGGGAKSMSQIGALRVIEQAGIKIDYISGSSMGAVIGAMYAMGYSLDEIETILKQVDWDQLLSDKIPRNRLPYLNKNDEKYLLNVNLNKGKFHLPTAFNNAHYLYKILNYITIGHHGNIDFSKLQTPFLCTATDLETGNSKIFSSGNLSDALRASVAFPSIFSPYQIDSTLYVDGGVRNNLPIEVLKKEKEIDIVIAIDVQDNLYQKNNINSIVQVLEQVGSFANSEYNAKQLAMADLVIKPAVTEYSIQDYAHTDTIVKRGYSAGISAFSELKKIAQRQGYPDYRTQTSKGFPPREINIDSVCITGVSPKSTKYAKGQFHLKKTKNYPIAKLNRGLDFLYGSGRYNQASFSYQKLANKNVLSLHLAEKPTKQTLRFGVHYDDDFSIALLANYTLREALLNNATFTTELAISENPRGNIQWIVDNGILPSLGLRASFIKFEPRLYENQQPIATFNYFAYNFDGFVYGTLANNFTLGTGFKWESVALSETLPTLNFENENNNYLIYHAFLDFDSFNKSFMPTQGYLLKSKYWIISNLRQDVAKTASSLLGLTFSKAYSFLNKFGGTVGLDAATTIGGNLDYPYSIFVGGLGKNYINFAFPFMGYRHMELIGNNFVAVNASFNYQFVKNHYVSIAANAGKIETTIQDLYNSNVILDGYGLSYGYKSPIGPLQLTVMGSTNHAKIFTYISLGFWF